jgi:hypothetical protein
MPAEASEPRVTAPFNLTVGVVPAVVPITIVVVEPVVPAVPILIVFVPELVAAVPIFTVVAPVAAVAIDAVVRFVALRVVALVRVTVGLSSVIVPPFAPIAIVVDAPSPITSAVADPEIILALLIFRVLPVTMFQFSDVVQLSFALSQTMLLSVAPFRMIPPPSAVASVGAPPVILVTVPAAMPEAAVIVIEVLLTIEATTVVVPVLPVPGVEVIVDPTTRPAVLAIPVIVPVVPDPETVPDADTIPETTAPISMFLSSTVRVEELIEVTTPLTVRSPPTITLLPNVVVPVPDPILRAVDAPAKFTVVAVVLIRSNDDDAVVSDVLTAGLALNMSTPAPPVSSEITPANSAEVVAAKTDNLSVVLATFVIAPVAPFTLVTPVADVR